MAPASLHHCHFLVSPALRFDFRDDYNGGAGGREIGYIIFPLEACLYVLQPACCSQRWRETEQTQPRFISTAAILHQGQHRRSLPDRLHYDTDRKIHAE